MAADHTIAFDNSYAKLPSRFYVKLDPTVVSGPELISVNDELAELLNIDGDYLRSDEGVSMLAGNVIPAGAEPLAAAYAGHQFGHFVPQLGDGRAVLLGEVVGRDGIRRDIQLKGAGRTPFSRTGDGRAALGPVLREYIVSEAMYHLGIPTTRTLAAVTTGDHVYREEPLPGAILARVAQSHVRVGTFQFFAARQDVEALEALSTHMIEHHYPEAKFAEIPALALLQAVLKRQADLIAKWLGVGFIHGVMNTDNMSIAGETIDYGPCAFLDAYHPEKVFSSVDQYGRYAFANQPSIGLWNLTRFAECLLPLIDEDQKQAIEKVQAVLNTYTTVFQDAYLAVFSRKLGIADPVPSDIDLVRRYLMMMEEKKSDFTLSFSNLVPFLKDAERHVGRQQPEVFQHPGFPDWIEDWIVRIKKGSKQDEDQATVLMTNSNPRIIPRNHMIETVISKAVGEQDFSEFHAMHAALSSPYSTDMTGSRYAKPPERNEQVLRTFCGT